MISQRTRKRPLPHNPGTVAGWAEGHEISRRRSERRTEAMGGTGGANGVASMRGLAWNNEAEMAPESPTVRRDMVNEIMKKMGGPQLPRGGPNPLAATSSWTPRGPQEVPKRHQKARRSLAGAPPEAPEIPPGTPLEETLADIPNLPREATRSLRRCPKRLPKYESDAKLPKTPQEASKWTPRGAQDVHRLAPRCPVKQNFFHNLKSEERPKQPTKR